jgi:hypothetical protein
VAMTMPSTSPIAQPVRQWIVAWIALRQSESLRIPIGGIYYAPLSNRKEQT